jgi:hypothetical protein
MQKKYNEFKKKDIFLCNRLQIDILINYLLVIFFKKPIFNFCFPFSF